MPVIQRNYTYPYIFLCGRAVDGEGKQLSETVDS